MKETTLRVIDLGYCSAREYLAASDVPALSSDETPILVFGVIEEESLCIGFNRRWEKSLTHIPKNFTRARLTTVGGAMYCRNVALFRMWSPRDSAEPFDLQSVLTNAVVDELEAQVAQDLSIEYDDKYALLQGEKFAGGSCNLINGRSSGLVTVNTGPTDFSSVRSLFKVKQVKAVRDLSAFSLPGCYYGGVFARAASSGGCRVIPSSWTKEEERYFEQLKKMHSDPRWIEDEASMELFEFRDFYQYNVYE